MTDPDSSPSAGRFRNWPTRASSGVGVPDIADNRLDQHDCPRLHTTAHDWAAVVGVEGLTVNGQQPSTLR